MGKTLQTIRVNKGFMRVDTTWYFDSPNVQKILSEREIKAMMKIGGYIKKTMQRSMRESTGRTPHAPAGKPPRYSKKWIRKNIDFKYEKSTHGVVIGPGKIRVNPVVQPKGKASVPQLLDESGMGTATQSTYVLKNRRTGKIASLGSIGGKKILMQMKRQKRSAWHMMELKPGKRRFEARPFKMDALRKNIKHAKLKQAWSVVR